jgi:UDP-N-acetylglucosamine--N-acetylmuramyl-(pentapeptide) pyrophosphoryl-undecaprenol N-acetylglucosamine transferase
MQRTASVRVLFGGGATGGHTYPALAIAEQLRMADSAADVLFASTAAGFDRRVLELNRCPFVAVSAGPVRGGSLLRVARGVARQPLWIAEARRLIRRFSPHIVVGTGGQVSGPLLAAARLAGVPGLLVELNVVPGLSNRMACRLVSSAAVGWPETAGRLSANTFFSGVPVRLALFDVPPPAVNGRIGIAVIGGSEGSARLNHVMRQALPTLATLHDRIEITHIAGDVEPDVMRKAYAAHGLAATVHSYVHDMAEVYTHATLVVAHAGASTCAELAATGRPSLLMPLNCVAGQHQTANARAMESRGAAILVEDDGRASAGIAAGMTRLMDAGVRETMSAAARALARRDASHAIVSRMLELTRQ